MQKSLYVNINWRRFLNIFRDLTVFQNHLCNCLAWDMLFIYLVTYFSRSDGSNTANSSSESSNWKLYPETSKSEWVLFLESPAFLQYRSSCLNTLTKMIYTADIYNTDVLHQTLRTLPNYLVRKWSEYSFNIRKREEPSLIHQENWLQARVMAAKDPYVSSALGEDRYRA